MTNATTITMDQGMANQASQAMQIQTYCNSVKQQVPVDFSQFPNLKDNQTQINQGLDLAKGTPTSISIPSSLRSSPTSATSPTTLPCKTPFRPCCRPAPPRRSGSGS
ncbi:hypothetical protein ACSZNP_06935 [Aeromonas hydrophila]